MISVQMWEAREKNEAPRDWVFILNALDVAVEQPRRLFRWLKNLKASRAAVTAPPVPADGARGPAAQPAAAAQRDGQELEEFF